MWLHLCAYTSVFLCVGTYEGWVITFRIIFRNTVNLPDSCLLLSWSTAIHLHGCQVSWIFLFRLGNAGITHTYIVTRWICYFLIAVAKHHDQKRITNVFCLWLHRHKSLSYQGGMTATQAWRQARKLNFHTLTKAQSSEGILEAGEAIHSQSPLLPSNASPNEVAPLRPLICHQEPRAKCSNV